MGLILLGIWGANLSDAVILISETSIYYTCKEYNPDLRI